MFDLDESEHTAKEPPRWWELLENTHGFIQFNYDEIMATGSEELKRAAAIVLGGYAPGGKPIKESELA